MIRITIAAALALAACGGADDRRVIGDEAGPRLHPASAADSTPGAVDSLLRAAQAESGGVMGVTAVHLETGRRISLNRAERFPMASVFKVAVATAVLERVQAGGLRLDDSLEVAPRHHRPTSPTVLQAVGPDGGRMTIRALMRAMLAVSDNTATDVLLERIGGPEAVMRHLRERGINGMRVDRTEAQMHWDAYGAADPPPEAEWTLQAFERAQRARTPAARDSIFRAHADDPRDTATPDATVHLLYQVHHAQAVSPEHRAWLLGVMADSPTGPERLKGMLPPGTVVAHKTGTAGRSVNDVGIVTLPEGRGHVAIAVYVKGSPRETAAVEGSIARAARAAYDHFVQAAAEGGR
ncbi:MAG TPA: class A beta-lactamase [Longimicrobium sp.]|nr:class A beta-lactamase [Longimicrobium sp.]